MKELVTYWKETFDWRQAVKKLNEFPHFTTNIEGIDLHFVHVKGISPHLFHSSSHSGNRIPLILIHG